MLGRFSKEELHRTGSGDAVSANLPSLLWVKSNRLEIAGSGPSQIGIGRRSFQRA